MVRVLAQEDIELFAVMSGDVNPAHLDADYADDTQFHHVVAHGMWGGALISAVLGTRLPGPGTIYTDQSLHFRAPGGDRRQHHRARHRGRDRPRERACDPRLPLPQPAWRGGDRRPAEVLAPRHKISRAVAELPTVRMHKPGARFNALVEQAHALPPMPTAVVHPCDSLSLLGAIQAEQAGLIEPFWVGPRAKIEATASRPG